MTAPRRFGPRLTDEGATFRLWAPAAREVDLVLDKAIPMTRRGDWFECHAPAARSGTLYRFRVDGGIEIADPASRFQPQDVQGPSQVVDHAYAWRTEDWKGRPWEEAVILELHVGTFTPEGTYQAAQEKLDHLAQTGITAIELMPLADFPGRWNWGYDGVLWFSPDSAYGSPHQLKQLVDAAHTRGLMVFLDVVYNHFGPEGNYLGRLAPQFFSEAQTPWGQAINYAVPEVRQFAIENALYWLSEYRFDGLRLDAVHAIATPGKPHLLHDLSVAVGAFARENGRHIHLVLENDDNAASLLDPLEDPPQRHFRAQWNDDYHHAWHVLLTGEKHGYYADYQDFRARIVRNLTAGFSYQGEPSPHRGGRKRGEASAGLPPAAFVNFLQNHDQIGNRALGDRLAALVSAEALRAAQFFLLLLPFPPLLFMGEEWGATEPFPFFCDFQGALATAVRKGRRTEFSEAYADPAIDVPDPLLEHTRDSARLDWGRVVQKPFSEHLSLVRQALAMRRDKIVPFMRKLRSKHADASFDAAVLQARWQTDGQILQIVANMSATAAAFAAPSDWGEPIWGGPLPALLPAWSVYAAMKSR